MQFSHNGKTYEVSATTVFQADMRNSCVVQLANIVQAHLGLSGFDEIPRSMDKLIAHYVDWNLCTKIDGKRVNLVMTSDAEAFLSFCEQVGNDNELAEKWITAYREVNKLNIDPVTEKNEQAPVSESET